MSNKTEKKLEDILKEAKTKTNWESPTILGGVEKKTCQCTGSYVYYTAPSWGKVCDASGYIKECEDCGTSP